MDSHSTGGVGLSGNSEDHPKLEEQTPKSVLEDGAKGDDIELKNLEAAETSGVAFLVGDDQLEPFVAESDIKSDEELEAATRAENIDLSDIVNTPVDEIVQAVDQQALTVDSDHPEVLSHSIDIDGISGPARNNARVGRFGCLQLTGRQMRFFIYFLMITQAYIKEIDPEVFGQSDSEKKAVGWKDECTLLFGLFIMLLSCITHCKWRARGGHSDILVLFHPEIMVLGILIFLTSALEVLVKLENTMGLHEDSQRSLLHNCTALLNFVRSCIIATAFWIEKAPKRKLYKAGKKAGEDALELEDAGDDMIFDI